MRFAPGFAPGRPVSLEPASGLGLGVVSAPDPAHTPWVCERGRNLKLRRSVCGSSETGQGLAERLASSEGRQAESKHAWTNRLFGCLGRDGSRRGHRNWDGSTDKGAGLGDGGWIRARCLGDGRGAENAGSSQGRGVRVRGRGRSEVLQPFERSDGSRGSRSRGPRPRARWGISMDSFERYVQPEVRVIRRGRMRLIPLEGPGAAGLTKTRR